MESSPPLHPARSASPERPFVLQARKLSKSFAAVPGSAPLVLFRELSFEIAEGESVAIVGQSGAGKSSLLHLLAGLDRPTSGEIEMRNLELTRLPPARAAEVRSRALGYVWQFHYLLPEFTALENIALPLMARGESEKQALAKAAVWLERVELTPRAHNRSGELSGGEQQRVAIARALVTHPQVLLADEPTGDLDDATAAHLFSLLQRLCREQGLATVVVTHNLDLAARCDRVLRLRDGRLEPAATGSA